MKYWAYVNNEILGPYEKEEVKALPAYSPTLLICPQTPVGEKTEEWREVSSCPEFAESSAADTSIVSEQIPDQIEIGTLQIDHNFNMSNSGRLNSARLGQLQPLENIGVSLNAGVDIPSNKLARSGRVKASEINWNLAAAEQEAEKAALPEQSAAAAPAPAENTPSSDPFGDIYKDIAGQSSSSAEQQPAMELEAMPSMADSASAENSISLGEMPMQNTQEFSLDGNSSLSQDQNSETPSLNRNLPLNDNQYVQSSPTLNMSSQAAADSSSGTNFGHTVNSADSNFKISGLEHKIDIISKNAITREDFTMAVDPIKMKLDQFDDMFSSIRNSQNQQQSDVMSKLSNLEQALQALASNINSQAAQAHQPFSPQMPPQTIGGFDSVSLTPSYGNSAETASLIPADPADSLKKEEKTKKHPKQEIKDTGRKASGNNIAVRFFKGLIKLIVFLVILAGLSYATASALKHYNVYNVSPMIIQGIERAKPDMDFKAEKNQIEMPYLLEKSDWNDYYSSPSDTQNGQASDTQQQTENEPLPEIDKETEALNAIKSYKKAEDGMTLETKLAEKAGSAGKWEIMPNGENLYMAIFIPEDVNAERYSFDYNESDGSINGKDEPSQAILNSLQPAAEQPAAVKEQTAQPAAKKAFRSRRKAQSAAAAEKTAQKVQAKEESSAQDSEFPVPLDDED